MHISNPAQKSWTGAHRGPDKEITFTREGKRAILNKLIEGRLREILRSRSRNKRS
jgi:2-oxoglutarate dehydrogenase E1 component